MGPKTSLAGKSHVHEVTVTLMMVMAGAESHGITHGIHRGSPWEVHPFPRSYGNPLNPASATGKTPEVRPWSTPEINRNELAVELV